MVWRSRRVGPKVRVTASAKLLLVPSARVLCFINVHQHSKRCREVTGAGAGAGAEGRRSEPEPEPEAGGGRYKVLEEPPSPGRARMNRDLEFDCLADWSTSACTARPYLRSVFCMSSLAR